MGTKSKKIGAPAAQRADGGFMPGWLPPAVVAVITFAVFSGILQNGFVNWDDDVNLLLNSDYRGLGWTQIKWMFTTFHLGHYQPLSWLTFALDYKLWGMNPKGYHLTSLLLHSMNAAVFYFVARRLLRLAAPGLPGENSRVLYLSAAFAALFFSIHPLRVEAVAWATERRDVLSGFFYLLTVLYYLKACAGGEGGSASPCQNTAYYPVAALALVLALYLISLLSKGIGVSLPAVLIALDIYPLRRLTGAPARWLSPPFRGVWLEKIPFALLSLAAGVAGLAAQINTGATQFQNIGGQPTLAARLLQALYGIGFYFWKTLAPFNLLPLYERPYHSNAPHGPIIIAAAAVTAATIIFILLRRRLPALLTVWACFIATLLPVLQIVPFGPYIVADRYSYLACLGWAALFGWAVLAGLRVLNTAGRKALLITAWLIIFGLGFQTWRQSRVWRGPDTLWRSVLAGNADSSIAHNDLGSILLDNEGKVEEAAAHFRQALRIRPDYAFAHYNYGNALSFQGRTDEAMEQYRHALRLMPAYADAYFNLGNALMYKGRTDGAIANYLAALRIRPDFAEVHANLGAALLRKNETGEAITHYREALRLGPANNLAWSGLEIALARQRSKKGDGGR